MNLISPEKLIEQKRIQNEQFLFSIEEYLDKNPPMLVGSSYHIKKTKELSNLVGHLKIYEICNVIEKIANKGVDCSCSYKYKCTYDLGVSFILSPISKVLTAEML